jgi:hypothetical protein
LQFRGLQQNERLLVQTEEEDCVGRLSGSSGSGCNGKPGLPARRGEPPLACLCSASDFYFVLFLANHRISGARFLLFEKGRLPLQAVFSFFNFVSSKVWRLFEKTNYQFFSNLRPKNEKLSKTFSRQVAENSPKTKSLMTNSFF